MQLETDEDYTSYIVEHYGKDTITLANDIVSYTPSTSYTRWREGANLARKWEELEEDCRKLLLDYLVKVHRISISDEVDDFPVILTVYNEYENEFVSLNDSYWPDGDDWEIADYGGDDCGYVLNRIYRDEDDYDEGETYRTAGALKYYSAKAEILIPAGQTMLATIRSEKKPKLYIGLELECIAKTEYIADKIHSNYDDYVLCKEDGSLPSNGLEIVTIPQTPEFHRVNMARLLEEYKDDLRAFREHSTGLHIHLNKKFFNNAQMGKMILFINHDDNYEFMKAIGQRDFKGHSYCSKYTCSTLEDCMEGRGTHRRPKSLGKYYSVNILPSTIELRFFKGNTKVESMLAKIDFVEAISHFVKKFKSKSMTHEKFVAYLNKSSNYPHLKKYLTRTLGIKFEITDELDEQKAA